MCRNSKKDFNSFYKFYSIFNAAVLLKTFKKWTGHRKPENSSNYKLATAKQMEICQYAFQMNPSSLYFVYKMTEAVFFF